MASMGRERRPRRSKSRSRVAVAKASIPLSPHHPARRGFTFHAASESDSSSEDDGDALHPAAGYYYSMTTAASHHHAPCRYSSSSCGRRNRRRSGSVCRGHRHDRCRRHHHQRCYGMPLRPAHSHHLALEDGRRSMAEGPPEGRVDFEHSSLTPIQSRSMLTCNQEFQRCFPLVYQGLCKGLIDVNRLISQEVVVPVKEEVLIHRSAIRSRWSVVASVSEQLWKRLHGRFPDPKIAPRLVRRVAEYFYDKIEAGVMDAEDERSLLQWMLRFDVENAIDIRVTTSLQAGPNSVIATIEGAAHVKRRKGPLFSLISKDVVVLDLEIVMKALFLNGGQLAQINSDPVFQQSIANGENRFATQFLLPPQ